MTIPRDDQISAILNAKEWNLAKSHGFSDPDDIPWSVSRDDVKSYIDKNGFPKGWVHFSEQTFDGVYLLPTGEDWKVCYQERGIIHYEERFKSRDEAMNYLLDVYYLKRKGIA